MLRPGLSKLLWLSFRAHYNGAMMHEVVPARRTGHSEGTTGAHHDLLIHMQVSRKLAQPSELTLPAKAVLVSLMRAHPSLQLLNLLSARKLTGRRRASCSDLCEPPSSVPFLLGL